MSFKRTKVVMLPTNEKASLLLGTSTEGQLVKSNGSISNSAHLKNQHLYFLSDDEIKEGDWYINSGELARWSGTPIIMKCNSFKESVDYSRFKNSYKKIIATTDKTLTWIKHDDTVPYPKGTQYFLPQPSETFLQKFIYAYNNGDPITEVMVEYKHLQSTTGLNEAWLKVNSSDNTITIRKMKDSWTREEVVSLCREAVSYNFNIQGSLFEKWIEENI